RAAAVGAGDQARREEAAAGLAGQLDVRELRARRDAFPTLAGMHVFVAGASGVIGRALVPMLVERGHAVTAMTRRPEGAELMRSLGAEPVLVDAFDAG